MVGGTIREILSHLFRHQMRTLLTITGLVIGILALSVAGSVGETLYTALQLQEAVSATTLTVRPARWDQPLTPATRRALRRVPGVAGTLHTLSTRLAAPEEEQVDSGLATERLLAIDSDIPGLSYGPPLVQGRLLEGRRPAAGATHEALLDFDLAQARGWGVGDTIPIRGRPFVVVGILERPPLAGERNAYLDYGTLRALLRFPTDRLDRVEILPEPRQDSVALAERIETAVPEARVITPEMKAQDSRQSFGILGAVAGMSAGLALMAGTLAIVNTMLMSVRERQPEIGLKKALGAGDGDILLEFLLEAGALGALGGASALLLAWFLSLGINQFTRAQWGLSLLTLTPRLALGALAFSTLLGALAGAYPAWRAARKDPIQALRNVPAAVYARGGPKRLLYRVARRARWLLTVAGISAGILILTVALSLAEFFAGYTRSAIEATHDRVGIYSRRDPRMALTTTLRELERLEGVRGVVTMAYGGRLFEEQKLDLGLMSHVPWLWSLDSPTGEFGFGVPTRAGIARGRFLTPDSQREVVLGSQLASSLGLGVGDTLAIRDRAFTVVGIWEASSPDFMTDYSFNAYVTGPALRTLNRGQPPYPQITALVAPGADPEALAARIREAMPQWSVQTNQATAQEIRQVMTIFYLLLVGYVSLGLLAGGLSVVNTMFMAVTGRTREIGVKKAVGASDGDILAEVVEESGWVGLLGGVLGVTAGWLVTVGVNTFTQKTLGASLMLVTPRLVVAALVFTTFLGMIAGIYPAWRASRLDPVRALRNE